MNDHPDKRLQPWRVLQNGSRVRMRHGLYAGAEGTVERLDDEVGGMARYAVTVDYGTATITEGRVFDACRYELQEAKYRPRRARATT